MNETVKLTVSGPVTEAAPRTAWSIRRTSTIDMHWPEGMGKPMAQQGHARDLLTPADPAAPVVLAEDRFTAVLTPGREILEIEAAPPRPGLEKLRGARAGGQLRSAIGEALPRELAQGTPLYLLLDDIAGSSLVAGWAWSRWVPDWGKVMKETNSSPRQKRSMEGVCINFRPGAPALIDPFAKQEQNYRQVGEVDAGDDPWAWHQLAEQTGMAARRSRRIDVRLADKVLVDAYFQDSCTSPSGQRWAVHEYLVSATADLETMTLQSIVADPRILPHDECPTAILNIQRLVGTPLAELRQRVLAELPRTEGCTHLNDMVRSLAEVPHLAADLAKAKQQAAK